MIDETWAKNGTRMGYLGQIEIGFVVGRVLSIACWYDWRDCGVLVCGLGKNND